MGHLPGPAGLGDAPRGCGDHRGGQPDARGLPAALRSAVRRGAGPAGTGLSPTAAGRLLDAVLCFKYLRTVANDNTIHFNGAALQALPDGRRTSYARTRVEVQERLDGSIVVVHQGRTVATEPAPAGPVALRARTGRRSNGQLPADSPARPARDGHRAQTTAPRPRRKPRPASPPSQRPTTHGGEHY